MTRGIAHPERPEVACDNSAPNHAECSGWDQTVQNYVDWPNPDHIPPKAVRGAREKVREMATRVQPAPRTSPLEGFAAGVEGSERAATRWDDAQKQLVDKAILAVATRHRRGGEFTTDAIWDELNGAVPVTKGLTSRLMVATRRGLIDNTGKTVISERGGHSDHGQRLSIWYSLVE